MNALCNKCGKCCRLIPIIKKSCTLVRDGKEQCEEKFLCNLKELTDEEAISIDENYVNQVRLVFPEVVFYACKCVGEDNLCHADTIPDLCKAYPSSELAFIPDECGYLGEIFLKNESLKRKIRKFKEEILDYETQIESGSKDSESYKKIVQNLKRFIQKYAEYGSGNW